MGGRWNAIGRKRRKSSTPFTLGEFTFSLPVDKKGFGKLFVWRLGGMLNYYDLFVLYIFVYICTYVSDYVLAINVYINSSFFTFLLFSTN